MQTLLNVQQETQKRLSDKDRYFPKQGFCLSGAHYQDFDRELEGLKSMPRVLGRESDPQLPLIKGEQCYFKRTCPHRGARLEKLNDKIECPYHGWVFDQQGRLQQAPGPCNPYKPGQVKLQKADVWTLAGMVFSGAEMGEFKSEIEELLPVHNFFTSIEKSIAGHWKFVVESLLETYHLQYAHPQMLKGFDNSFYSWGEKRGRDIRITVPLSSFQESGGMDLMYFVFPFTFFLVMQQAFVCFQIIPVAKDRTNLRLHFFGHQNSSSQYLDGFSQALSSIIDQDVAIIQGQQANLTREGRFLLTGHETMIQKFHQQIAEEMLQSKA